MSTGTSLLSILPGVVDEENSKETVALSQRDQESKEKILVSSRVGISRTKWI